MSDNTIYNWNFSTEKNRWELWYIIWFSVVVWLVTWGFFSWQYWMSFVILLISWLYFFMENNSEDIVQIAVTELWINIANSFYDFSRINSYTFIYEWPNATLLRLNLENKGIKNIDLKVDNNITADLKNILPNFIEENPKIDMTFSEKLIRMLKL